MSRSSDLETALKTFSNRKWPAWENTKRHRPSGLSLSAGARKAREQARMKAFNDCSAGPALERVREIKEEMTLTAPKSKNWPPASSA